MNETCDRRPGHRARDAATVTTTGGRARPLNAPSIIRANTYTQEEAMNNPIGGPSDLAR